MNKMSKQIMIYSLAGIMQLGLGAATVEAASLQFEGKQTVVELGFLKDLRDALRD